MHTKTQKRKLRIFIYAKEAFVLSLIILSFVFVGLGHFGALTHEQLLRIEVYEVLVSLLFLAEFIFELFHAKDRRFYIKHHWYYLLAAIPIPIESFELLKGVRALRLVQILKSFSHLRYEYNTHLFSRSKSSKKVH